MLKLTYFSLWLFLFGLPVSCIHHEVLSSDDFASLASHPFPELIFLWIIQKVFFHLQFISFMYKIHDPCTYIGRLFWISFKEKLINYTFCLQSKHAVFKENQFWLLFGMRKFITIHKQFPLMLRKFLLIHYHACLLCPLCSCWVLPLSSALVWS